MTHKIRVGVQLHPQQTTYPLYAQAIQRVEAIGVDTVFNWDHFFPLYGNPNGNHFEGWTLLTAMAGLTTRVEVGCLVTGNGYRNPQLLADMARTLDHISGGRLILGIGAGWNERDYTEYGYPFGSAIDRVHIFSQSLPLLIDRLGKLVPAPTRHIPLLIGAAGEKVMLRLVAQYADIWNTFGPPENYRRKSAILDEWCNQVGRDPAEIERSVSIEADELDQLDEYIAIGATHFILSAGSPFDFDSMQRLVRWRDRINS
jgi:probable F420-dependent oxidoreductase